MKNLLILITAILISSGVFAQKNVKVKINHKMNGVPFALNTETNNSFGNKLNFKRVQYYLSNFKIVHDGGTETTVSDKYFLVDASKSIDLDLGVHNVTTIEKIIFSVGVDKDKNHLNPAIYSDTHALAPKSPSMHWGWASGYRFVAIEGKSGTNLSRTWEFHSLGDKYFYTIYLPTAATANGNELLITLNADYSKALSGINISEGMVVHGEENQDLIVLDNFRDSVFSNLDGVLKIGKISLEQYRVYPNPSSDGEFQINSDIIRDASSIKVYDLLGKEINSISMDEVITSFNIPNNGVYFIRITLKNNTIYSQKLIVNK